MTIIQDSHNYSHGMTFDSEWTKDSYDDLWELYFYLIKHKAPNTIIHLRLLCSYGNNTYHWNNCGLTKRDYWYKVHPGYGNQTIEQIAQSSKIPFEVLMMPNLVFAQFVFRGSFKKKLFAKKILMAKVAGLCKFKTGFADNDEIMSVLNKS